MQAARGAAVAADVPAGSGVGHRRTLWLGSVAACVVAADLVSKLLVVSRLSEGQTRRVVGGLLKVTLTRNSGAAFSVGTGATVIFTAVAVGVIVVILRTARTLASRAWATALGLLLGGAIGNLLDRIFRHPAPLRGHVVDWIELPHWPVFNVADAAIVIGGCLAVLLSLRGRELGGASR